MLDIILNFFYRFKKRQVWYDKYSMKKEYYLFRAKFNGKIDVLNYKFSNFVISIFASSSYLANSNIYLVLG